jgi:hypothetical protein
MSKEPNGVLVMTTCKCRENIKNLVMTRTYFTEMLENKIAWGAKQEQERIIQLIKEEAGAKMAGYEGQDWLISLIKGEN